MHPPEAERSRAVREGAAGKLASVRVARERRALAVEGGLPSRTLTAFPVFRFGVADGGGVVRGTDLLAEALAEAGPDTAGSSYVEPVVDGSVAVVVDPVADLRRGRPGRRVAEAAGLVRAADQGAGGPAGAHPDGATHAHAEAVVDAPVTVVVYSVADLRRRNRSSQRLVGVPVPVGGIVARQDHQARGAVDVLLGRRDVVHRGARRIAEDRRAEAEGEGDRAHRRGLLVDRPAHFGGGREQVDNGVLLVEEDDR